MYPAEITISNGKIAEIRKTGNEIDPSLQYILPGFIDSHVHIESSMLVPSEFARLAVLHGTVATVSDPHEIANVCGMKGIEFMINNAKKVLLKFYFGAPSCVPATAFETAGATINADDISSLFDNHDIRYLSEMMNYPGAIAGDPEILARIKAATSRELPVDGHAPGLRGDALQSYIDRGISTDHESFTYEEGLEKLQKGMRLLIREGSAAKNFDALIPLLHEYPGQIMFCSDDKHPDNLIEGHINQLVTRALANKISLFKVLRAACVNPVLHYRLDVGLLRIGDAADFIIVDHPAHFELIETWINGICVARHHQALFTTAKEQPINIFNTSPVSSHDLRASVLTHVIDGMIPVINAIDGQLVTKRIDIVANDKFESIVSDIVNDILKIVVVNRYLNAPPAVAFVKGFGLRSGAIASSVAHDSHNIIATGSDDELIARAINLIIAERGGICCVTENEDKVLPLPVAGLMSIESGEKVADEYTTIDKLSKSCGSTLNAPFMTLSFMALLVIPELKLSDRGLFDGTRFRFLYSDGGATQQ
jgi:adenine deaminase